MPRKFINMILKIPSDRRIWITSDTHYAHVNICRSTTNWRTPEGNIPLEKTRDFSSLDRMNDTIVNNINNVVGYDDVLIHVGDWSFAGFDNIALFRNRLVCQEIHLVLGNHDHHIDKNKSDCWDLFTTVSDHLRLTHKKRTFEIFHYPIVSWADMGRGTFHLHGHTHLSLDKRFGVGRRMDIGIDGHPEFRPYDLEAECVVMLKQRSVDFELGDDDHHSDDLSL